MKFLVVLILFLIIIYMIIKLKIKKVFKDFFGTISLKNILEQEKILDENTPKSLSSLDCLYLEQIKQDFKELNINELKSEAEKSILECYNTIEKKDIKYLTIKSKKIREFVISKINDCKKDNISYKNIKIHKTVISKYEKTSSTATIYFQTAFQYRYREDNSNYILKQDRITTEYIYVINENKLPNNIKAIGLNCPNCGAPITTLNNRICKYCGSGIINLVKKNFILNNIANK